MKEPGKPEKEPGGKVGQVRGVGCRPRFQAGIV